MGRFGLDVVAINNVLHAAYSGITAHGIARSSFRDWVAEATEFTDKVAEAALNHTNPNETEAAYLRTNFLDRRVELMNARGAFFAAAKIMPLNRSFLAQPNRRFGLESGQWP